MLEKTYSMEDQKQPLYPQNILSAVPEEAAGVQSYKWRAKFDDELKALIVCLKDELQILFVDRSLRFTEKNPGVDDPQLVTLFKVTPKHIRLLMFTGDAIASKELDNGLQAQTAPLTFLNKDEKIVSINHYNSRSEMARIFLATSSGRCFHLTFRIDAEGQLVFLSQPLEEKIGFFSMVTGFFSKTPFYTHYQERTRIIAVSSKQDEYYAQTKRQLIFCISDLYIKVWRMEARATRTELTYAGKTTCSERIIQDAERSLGVKIFNMSILAGQTKGYTLTLLVKLVSGKPGSGDIREDLVVYEWSFTPTNISTGVLTLTRAVPLEAQIIKDVSMIRVSYLFSSEGIGLAVIDREGDYHKVFLYDFSRGCMDISLPQAVYGCGSEIGENFTVTVVTKDGLVKIAPKMDTQGNAVDLVVYSEEVMEEAPAFFSEAGKIETEESLERILVEYSKGKNKEALRNKIVSLVKGWGEIKFQQLAAQLVEKSLNQEKRGNAPPIMKKEEVEKDIDKGLIMYQLKYIHQIMTALAELFIDCGFSGSASLANVYWKAIECCERSATGSELRRLQNEYLVKARRSERINAEMDPYLAAMYSKTISEGIEAVLAKRGITKEELEREGITAADMFYSDLRKLEELFEGLATLYENNFAHKSDENAFRVMEIINAICLNTLKSVRGFRQEKDELYQVQANGKDFIWTADLETINTFFYKNVLRTIGLCNNPMCLNKDTLKKQVFELVDIILNEMVAQIKTQGLDEYSEYFAQFREIKRKVLDKTTDLDSESTLKLAIYYKDFEKVVELCEKTHNREKLYELIGEWREFGFLEGAFQWYVKSYKEAAESLENVQEVAKFNLFEVFEERYPTELEAFLKRNYPKMLWLYYIKQKRNDPAGPELTKCAQAEKKLSVLQKLLRVGVLNNLVVTFRKEKYDYLLALEKAQELLKEESVVADDEVRSFEETYELLLDFSKTGDVNSRIKCAHQLLTTVEPSKRPNRLYQLYENVLEYDKDLLKMIAEDKLGNLKSDPEIEAETHETGLFTLTALPDDVVSLTGEEISELREKYAEVKDAFDLIRAHKKYAMHL